MFFALLVKRELPHAKDGKDAKGRGGNRRVKDMALADDQLEAQEFVMTLLREALFDHEFWIADLKSRSVSTGMFWLFFPSHPSHPLREVLP